MTGSTLYRSVAVFAMPGSLAGTRRLPQNAGTVAFALVAHRHLGDAGRSPSGRAYGRSAARLRRLSRKRVHLARTDSSSGSRT